ncbi:MAG: hypothetical protein RIR11_698 [Bacteroidota bacterium]|jgi:hypothetical protein
MYLEFFINSYREKNGEKSLSDGFATAMQEQILALICDKHKVDPELFDSKTTLWQRSWLLLHPLDSEENAQYFRMDININQFTFTFDVYFRGTNGEKIRVDDPLINSKNTVFWFKSPPPYFEEADMSRILNTKHKVDFPRISKKSLHYDLEIDSFYPEAFYLKIKLEDEGTQQQAIVGYLDHLLTEHNEKMGEKKGFVHDFGLDKWEHNILSYYIDLGSAPIKTIVTILNGINQFETIGVVRIC